MKDELNRNQTLECIENAIASLYQASNYIDKLENSEQYSPLFFNGVRLSNIIEQITDALQEKEEEIENDLSLNEQEQHIYNLMREEFKNPQGVLNEVKQAIEDYVKVKKVLEVPFSCKDDNVLSKNFVRALYENMKDENFSKQFGKDFDLNSGSYDFLDENDLGEGECGFYFDSGYNLVLTLRYTEGDETPTITKDADFYLQSDPANPALSLDFNKEIDLDRIKRKYEKDYNIILSNESEEEENER